MKLVFFRFVLVLNPNSDQTTKRNEGIQARTCKKRRTCEKPYLVPNNTQRRGHPTPLRHRLFCGITSPSPKHTPEELISAARRTPSLQRALFGAVYFCKPLIVSIHVKNGKRRWGIRICSGGLPAVNHADRRTAAALHQSRVRRTRKAPRQLGGSVCCFGHVSH